MSGKFQLQIPTPCREDWDAMRPEEKGRYCASCQKIVVDFTVMSDAGIISHMARAGQHVCGRLARDQLNRNLSMLPPPHRNGVRGWPWLLAGVLVAGEPSMRRPPLKGEVVAPKGDTVERPFVTMGEPTVKLVGKVAVDDLPVKKGEIVRVVDTTGDKREPLMGTPVCIKSDTLSMIPEDLVKPKAGEPLYGIAGGISVGVTVSPAQNLLDTVKHWVEDTLAAVRLLPEQGFSVYPNPVRGGSVVSLSWRAEPGTYQVGLFSIASALIQQREMVVNAKGQVDLFEVPAGLAAGVYVIRAAGSGKGMTRKLVVQ